MKLILLICMLSIFISCSPFDKVSRTIKKENKSQNMAKIEFLAESTATPKVYFKFLDNNRFELIDVRNCAPKCKLKYFTGTYSEKNDTINLQYYKNYRPMDKATFLLKDLSRENLYWLFTSNNIKLQMKIRRRKV